MRSIKIVCLMGFVAVLLVAGQAVGAVIYYDSFSGSSSDNLNGKVSDAGGGIWQANTTRVQTWKQDGSIIGSTDGTGGGRQQNAFLPFTPETGYIYTLSAKITNVDTLYYGSQMWIGFEPSSDYFGNLDWAFISTNIDSWVTREAGSNKSQGVAGPSGAPPWLQTQFYHNATSGSTIAVTLDTTGAQWKSQFCNCLFS